MFYRLAWSFCRVVLILVRRLEINGLENVPVKGGLVVVSNHRSYWDPMIVGCSLPKNRQVFFMAKEELFKVPILRNAIKWAGAFPVRRMGADRSAIRTALNHLISGRVVGIFPEGTRSKTDQLLEPQIGMAMLSTKAGVPILPVAVVGSKGIFGKVVVNIGQVILAVKESTGNIEHKYSRSELVELSSDVMNKVAELLESRG
ncbi:MAG: 1-acyl-sn-glycerol-3-phosphate acyltransferase [Peptococcaceae bacterium]|nr:1-acyl-sn-glycerol-3-phosphate acyltransferase [Peptococcaceae bacterium]